MRVDGSRYGGDHRTPLSQFLLAAGVARGREGIEGKKRGTQLKASSRHCRMRKRGVWALRRASLAGERWGLPDGRCERGVGVSEGWGVTRSPLTPRVPESVIPVSVAAPDGWRSRWVRTKVALLRRVLTHFSRVRLCDPMACSPAGRLCPWGFSRQESWSGWPCPTSRGSSRPSGQNWVSCMGRRILFRAHTLGSPGNLRVCS